MKIVEDIHGYPLGVVTYLMLFESGEDGEVAYQTSDRPVQRTWLGPGYDGMAVPGIVQPTHTAFYNPLGNELIGIYFDKGDDSLIVYFGERWGELKKKNGDEMKTPHPDKLIKSMFTSVITTDSPAVIGIRFLMNMHNIKSFTPEVRRSIIEPHHLTYMEIFNFAETGEYRNSRMQTINKQSQRLISIFDIKSFPIKWPLEKLLAPNNDSRSLAEDASLAHPTGRSPLPITTNMHLEEMAKVINAEPDEFRKWRMIEQNLQLHKPERTYVLASQFPDVIAKRIDRWPKARLVSIFGSQPGVVIEQIGRYLHFDKTLQLAEESVEEERVMEWLRDREVERMMKLDVNNNGTLTADEARELLHVSEDYDVKEIKKVWRRLLGFLNADFGRGSEKAIHQKKDQIAKKLQAARNLLMK